MSPMLKAKCVSTPESSLLMIASTPSSEMTIPRSCPRVSRSPNMTALATAMNTGPSEFITETLSAVVSCSPTNCSAPNTAPPISAR